MPKNTNPIWEFFDEDNEKKRADCKLCGASYSYVSTTNNLKAHLKRKHGFDDSDFTKDFEYVLAKLQIANAENDTDNNETSFISKKRRNASYLWKVFQKIEKYTAKCRLCDQNVRFKGTTGNLSVHLKRYHDDALEKIREAAASNDEVILESDEEADSLHGQDIYFEQEDDGVKCTVCGKNISDAGEDPREHLEEHHPALLAKIIKNEDRAEEEEEDETQNEKDIFTEVVYLDQVSPPQIKKRQPQTKKPTIDNQKKRKLSTNSDEPLVKSKKTSEIESFTNYIKVLLEKLPQDVCSRLQLEIISIIMAAKLNLPSNSTSVSTPVSGNITADDNYVQEDN